MMHSRSALRIPYYIFTFVMCALFLLGIFRFVTVPVKARAAADEIEEMLRKNQAEAEERMRVARMDAAAWRKELALDAGSSQYEKLPLYMRYKDASELHVTGIGDSVMLAALPQLYEVFPYGYFDAVFGRTLFEGRSTVYRLEEQDAFGDLIIYSLTTNSYVEESDLEDLISHSAGRPTFWITTYGVANDSNAKVRRVAARHDDAYIIEWEELATAHAGAWILNDGLHPNAAGSMAYAELIRETINEALLTPPENGGEE